MKPFHNQKLLSALKDANSVFLSAHILPDGDAVGSLLAAGMILEAMGKKVVMANSDDIPAKYMFLPGADRIVKPEGLDPAAFDTAMSVDVSELHRMGDCDQIYTHVPVRLQIDHHGTNPLFAQENEVDAEAPAAGCLVARLAYSLGVPLTKEMAVCLYTAISSDTGNFCFAGVDAETFEIMQHLMEAGLEIVQPARQIHLMREKEYLGLLGRALCGMKYLFDGRATMTMITPRDFEDCHASQEHSDGIVNYGLYIPGVRLTVFVDAHEREQTRFSIRSIPPVSACAVASALGGGGHDAAAGCTLQLPAEKAIPLMLAEVEKELSRHL